MYVDSHSLGQLALASKRTASVNKYIFFKFQLICMFVTMVTKYGIYHKFDMGEGLVYNFFYLPFGDMLFCAMNIFSSR